MHLPKDKNPNSRGVKAEDPATQEVRQSPFHDMPKEPGEAHAAI